MSIDLIVDPDKSVRMARMVKKLMRPRGSSILAVRPSLSRERMGLVPQPSFLAQGLSNSLPLP